MSAYIKGIYVCDYTADTNILPDILAQINEQRAERELKPIDVITKVRVNFNPDNSVSYLLPENRPDICFNENEAVKFSCGEVYQFGADFKGNITMLVINCNGQLEVEYTYLDFNG